MTARNRPVPQYIDGLLDLEAFRSLADARGTDGKGQAMNLKPPRDVTLIAATAVGLVACVIVATAVASTPAARAARVHKDVSTFGEQLKRNAAALARSGAWWERYGQRHAGHEAVAAR
jgi:hypothetical protein